MKILGVSCSPRKKGNTVTLLEEMLRGAEENGANIELFSVSGKNIRGCDGCYSCLAKGECHIQDNMQPLYIKLMEADGIVFSSPIYFYTMESIDIAFINDVINILNISIEWEPRLIQIYQELENNKEKMNELNGYREIVKFLEFVMPLVTSAKSQKKEMKELREEFKRKSIKS